MENSGTKILLVDDEQDILEFIGYSLKKEGFTVFTALNGKDAIWAHHNSNQHFYQDCIFLCIEPRSRVYHLSTAIC